MNDTEIAWAAGFFDGEGTVVATQHRCAGRYSLKFTVPQTDKRPLVRFARAVDIPEGRIYRVSARGRSRESWRLQFGNTQAIRQIMERLIVYLSEPKREQYAAAVNKLDNQRPTIQGGKGQWRKTKCIRGHLLAETRRISRSGKAQCIRCRDIRNHARNWRAYRKHHTILSSKYAITL